MKRTYSVETEASYHKYNTLGEARAEFTSNVALGIPCELFYISAGICTSIKKYPNEEVSQRDREILYKKVERASKIIRQLYNWGDEHAGEQWILPNGSSFFDLIAQAEGALGEIIEQCN